jgi:NAD(P)-dependent dehydrogenase (short-subunit alcohol dehydrogenase family)
VAVVTGARQGLGRVVAQHLAGQGYALALLDIGASAATEESVRVHGVAVLSVEVDVADEAGVRAATDRVLDRFGQVDVLVNNAGISLIAPAEATSVEQWRRVLEVNLTGPFLLCRAFGGGMLARGRGSIVNIASIAGLRGIADRAAYNASKHGLVGLTRTLAVDGAAGASGSTRSARDGSRPRWISPIRAPAPTPTTTSSSTSRWAASPGRRTSRRRSPSWPTTPPVGSSTVRSSASTAAGTPTAAGSDSGWRSGSDRAGNPATSASGPLPA